MNRRMHTLDYQPHPDRDISYIGVSFPMLLFADYACECRREYDSTFDTFADELFEQFTRRYELTPYSAFDEFISDKMIQYANADATKLYWFKECCSMGGSYRTLSMITTWPVIRPKTEAEVDAELTANSQFISNKREHMRLLKSSIGLANPLESIWLSPSIQNLTRTPNEKILLARICQRASLTAGVCSDTNRELGQATILHPQTVSDLISRFVKAELVSTVIDKEHANRRTLMPRQDLLIDYLSIASKAGKQATPTAKRPAPLPNIEQVGDEATGFLAGMAITPTQTAQQEDLLKLQKTFKEKAEYHRLLASKACSESIKIMLESAQKAYADAYWQVSILI